MYYFSIYSVIMSAIFERKQRYDQVIRSYEGLGFEGEDGDGELVMANPSLTYPMASSYP